MSIKAPHRAFRLSIKLEADTRSDMASALINLAHRIEREQVTNGCWGSPSDGAIYELLSDPEITHDVFHASLVAYLDQKAKEDRK